MRLPGLIAVVVVVKGLKMRLRRLGEVRCFGARRNPATTLQAKA